MIQASCPENGIVADFFAGSGSSGAAAYELGRRFLMVDDSPEACAVMRDRFAGFEGVVLRRVRCGHPVRAGGAQE